MKSWSLIRSKWTASSYIAVIAAPFAFCASSNTGAQALGTSDETGPSVVQLTPVVVTAERIAQPESKIPISIVAYTRAALDRKGIQDISDLALQTPGITYSQSSIGGNDISIDGIDSTIGAQTTGIYLNDTPIQVRNAGYTSANVYPIVFDLERVEVLRGPQGTLFGAGSEGGAIRFITPTPSFTEYSVYARTDLSQTDHGGSSYDAGVAGGGPIIDDRLAIRGSAYFEQTGGYINRLDPLTGQVADADANRSTSQAETLSLAYKPARRLSITASVYQQYIVENSNDQTWWEQLSNPSDGEFASGNLLSSPRDDRLVLPSLNLTYDFDSVQLISNTSYMDHHAVGYPDYSEFLHYLLTGNPYPTSPDQWAKGNFLDTQRYFTEEFRVQSANPNASLRWVGGVFFQRNKQSDEELVSMPNLPEVWYAANGYSYVDYFGTPLGPGDSVYTDAELINERQVAAFGQIDYQILKSLTVTAGVRLSRYDYSFSSQNAGPFAGVGTSSGSTTENSVDPKYAISYQVNDGNLLYASASKGFRPGGAERVPPNVCDSDLHSLGLQQAPSTYQSDYVWDYALGSKNRFGGGRFSLDESIFYIKWYNIEQEVSLPVCGQSTILNLGSATSKGFDINWKAVIANSFLLNIGMSYTEAADDKTISIPGAANPLVDKGDSIGGALFAPFQLTSGVEYDRTLFGRDAYARADYQFHGRGPKPDPLLVGYDPTLPRTPSSGYLSLRAGITLSEWELSLFAKNVANSHTELQRSREYFTPLYYGITYRPREIGIQAIYRSR